MLLALGSPVVDSLERVKGNGGGPPIFQTCKNVMKDSSVVVHRKQTLTTNKTYYWLEITFSSKL